MPSVLPFKGYHPEPELLEAMLAGRTFNRYDVINRDFRTLLGHGLLHETHSAAYYFLEITTDSRSFRGLWTSTRVSDLASVHILGHERISEERKAAIYNSIEAGGLDINPLIFNYDETSEIESFFTRICSGAPIVASAGAKQSYKIWACTQPMLMTAITRALALINPVYIADGHHRSAALLRFAGVRDLYFSSLFFTTQNLEIHAFHRLVDEISTLNAAALVGTLQEYYTVEQLADDLPPPMPYCAGMITMISSCAGSYILKRHEQPAGKSDLDYFESVFKSRFPNLPLRFQGGPGTEPAIISAVRTASNAAAFLFYPPSMFEIRAVSNRGAFLPAKSSWFEPKIPSGLLIRRFV